MAPTSTPRVGSSKITSLGCCTDRKSTRLNSSHGYISYAVFCLKKKNKLDLPLPKDRSLLRKLVADHPDRIRRDADSGPSHGDDRHSGRKMHRACLFALNCAVGP